MTRKAYIAVDMRGEGGKEPVYELIARADYVDSEGNAHCELSAVETLELGLNATSSMRWSIPLRKK